jgi:hypothetical protein
VEQEQGEADSDPDGLLTIAGKVLDIDGRPAVDVTVRVLDQQANGIPNSNVAFQLGHPNTIRATTDDDGLARIQILTSEVIQAVVAWKDHAGLDFKVYSLPRGQESDQLAQKPEFPWVSGETLTLEGTQPLTVKLIDNKGLPLAGIDA